MQPKELRDWLLREGVAVELALATRLSAAAEFGGLELAEELQQADLDWRRALLAASVLAGSDERQHQEAALRLATAALALPGTTPQEREGAALVLERLDNARGAGLAASRGLVGSDLSDRVGFQEILGSTRRRLDSSIVMESGELMFANRFQRVFWREAARADWVSASAPTAAGKTHVVLRWLLDTIVSGRVARAVYLAPTRALVSEIEAALRELAPGQRLEGLAVSTLPVHVLEPSGEGSALPPVVHVLTQERLQLLANEGAVGIDLLVVDEAHKVGEEGRGVVLQDAVERMARANPRLRVVFLAPGAENPEELLSDAPAGVVTGAVSSDIPTVCQNVVAVTQRPGDTKTWSVALVREGAEPAALGVVRLDARPTTIPKKMALIARALGGSGGVLVYANGAVDAEKVAAVIADLNGDADDEDGELRELDALVRDAVHPSFALRRAVRRGVGFHYGNMPSIVRGELERAFREGRLRHLVCTSTLIEGVNLACRTIVVRGPRKGISRPMEAHDFWNLAGRAGRWGHDLQGNVVCIEPHDRSVWPSDIPPRARHRITRETDAALRDADTLARYIHARWEADADELAKSERLEHVSAYLLGTWMRDGSLRKAPWSARQDPGALEKIAGAIEAAVARVDLPPEIAERHCGISIIGMQRLLDYFRGRRKPVEELLPEAPEGASAYTALVRVFNRIQRNIFPAFGHIKRVPVAALVTLDWMRGRPLPRIIDARREWAWQRPRGGADGGDLQALIRDTMSLVEQVARYRAPRFLSCYMDVLAVHLREIERPDLINGTLRFDLYLEFGVATTTLLSLVGLGLSRHSALALGEYIGRDDLDQASCLEWVAANDLSEMSLPRAVKSEIHRKFYVRRGDPAPLPSARWS